MSLNIFRQVIWWPRYLKKPIYSIIALIYGLSLSITDLIRLFWERNRPLDLRDLMGKLCVDFISSLLFLSLYLFSLKIGFICGCHLISPEGAESATSCMCYSLPYSWVVLLEVGSLALSFTLLHTLKRHCKNTWTCVCIGVYWTYTPIIRLCLLQNMGYLRPANGFLVIFSFQKY